MRGYSTVWSSKKAKISLKYFQMCVHFSHKTNFTHKFYRENLSIFLVWWGIHHLLKFYWNQSLFWTIFLNFSSSFISKALNPDIRALTRSNSTPWPNQTFRLRTPLPLGEVRNSFQGFCTLWRTQISWVQLWLKVGQFLTQHFLFFMLNPTVPSVSLVSG